MINKSPQNSKSNISYYYLSALKNLHTKYNSFENSYELICINNLIYTENCHIVARFKDFLYYDDSTEFLNKFFPKDAVYATLTKIFNFYAKYCKVFPNYMILPENEFLYRNLRKKQKMIDQFNEIKREEEENRNHLKLKKNKDNENDYILFNKKVQESIEKYKPSFTQSTIIMMDYINFNNSKISSKIFNENSISISLNYNNDNLFLNDINSSELTLISITNNININTTPNKNEKSSNNNKLSFTPTKKKIKTEKIESIGTKDNNELNKKYISHYQNIKKTITKNNSTNENININNKNSTNYNTNSNTNTNTNKVIHKKVIKNINHINNVNNNKMKKSINFNNNSQTKITGNIIFFSNTKSNKEKSNKNIAKNIKSNLTKKNLFPTTEKIISHKKPIYNYKNKKAEKNSNSINSKKYKKNNQEKISISMKPSISPPSSKYNSLKLKMLDNLISKNKNIKSNILIYNKNNNNFNNFNNLSYMTKNKNIKSFQNNDINDNIEKTNTSKNIIEKISKNNSNNSNNFNNGKKSIKEIMNNYKNIIKTKKNCHYSHDINKNNLFINKKIFNNLTEKNIQKSTSNRKSRKTEPYNKYISPGNKKDTIINGKNPKTPLKPEFKMNNKFQNIIIKTKEASQTKIQNYIKKILDKNNNKNNYFINQSRTRQKMVKQ